MTLATVLEDKRSRMAWPADPRLDERHRNMRLVLAQVRSCRGQFTVSMGHGRTGLHVRSIQRYLDELRSLGLVDRHDHLGVTKRWTITQAGVDELSGVT